MACSRFTLQRQWCLRLMQTTPHHISKLIWCGSFGSYLDSYPIINGTNADIYPNWECVFSILIFSTSTFATHSTKYERKLEIMCARDDDGAAAAEYAVHIVVVCARAQYYEISYSAFFVRSFICCRLYQWCDDAKIVDEKKNRVSMSLEVELKLKLETRNWQYSKCVRIMTNLVHAIKSHIYYCIHFQSISALTCQ